MKMAQLWTRPQSFATRLVALSSGDTSRCSALSISSSASRRLSRYYSEGGERRRYGAQRLAENGSEVRLVVLEKLVGDKESDLVVADHLVVHVPSELDRLALTASEAKHRRKTGGGRACTRRPSE